MQAGLTVVMGQIVALSGRTEVGLVAIWTHAPIPTYHLAVTACSARLWLETPRMVGVTPGCCGRMDTTQCV